MNLLLVNPRLFRLIYPMKRLRFEVMAKTYHTKALPVDYTRYLRSSELRARQRPLTCFDDDIVGGCCDVVLWIAIICSRPRFVCDWRIRQDFGCAMKFTGMNG